jgi:hypothetical protein
VVLWPNAMSYSDLSAVRHFRLLSTGGTQRKNLASQRELGSFANA